MHQPEPRLGHWSDAYVGRPYVRGEQDCGHLAAAVAREVYGRDVRLPEARPRNSAELSDLVARLRADHGERVAQPAEGDAVLMLCGARWHVGVFLRLAGEDWVLHNLKGVGSAVRTRLRGLEALGLRVEGYYRWKG